MRRILFVVLLAACLFSCFGSVFAWNTGSVSGDWIDSSLNSLAGGDGNGYVNSTNIPLSALTDGQGYELTLYINDISGRKDWWSLFGVKRFCFAVDFESANGQDVFGWMYVAHEMGLVYNTSQCFVGSNKYDLGNKGFWDFPNIDVHDAVYYMQIIRLSNTSVQIGYKALTTNDVLTSDPVPMWYSYNETFTVRPDFWDHVDAYLYAGHDGFGSFSVQVSELNFDADIQGYTDTDVEGNAPFDFWSYINSIWNFVTSIFATIVLIGKTIIPLLPWLAVSYFMDALVTSIATSSFQPIGVVFRTLWGMIHDAAEMIWGFLQAIATALPF